MTLELSGPRRVLQSRQPSDISVLLSLAGALEGMQMVPVAGQAFNLPDAVQVLDISPRQVLVELRTTSPETNSPSVPATRVEPETP